MKNRAITALSLAAFVALAGCADTEPGVEMESEDEMGMEQDVATEPVGTDTGIGEWDVDTDEALDQDEWNVWWTENEVGADWDADETEGLSEEEWSTTTYALWDVDDDDRISEDEWAEGTERWFGTNEFAWNDWDGDGDSYLDANELAEGMEREGLYDQVDSDDDLLVDDEELTDWFFDVFDANDDQKVDVTEWDWGANYDFAGNG